ncbi:CLUMA_CG020475, isoform A [Clunio marinus]|uniref:CLUMA_CG020475, isoform A n=1 Tax=Clunio marinus TaxID=568069 RepID=A0A1J1J7R2_9DIPT|nr:CLUMA_CG020475, isoform A [Clunio marinus]
MKSLIILLFATVIASGDAAQKCQEVTDPCASVRADAAPIYENANNGLKDAEERCEAQLEAVEPRPASDGALNEELRTISQQCQADLSNSMQYAATNLGGLVGLDPPESYVGIFLQTEREGMSACLVETDSALLTSYQSIFLSLEAIAESKRL